ncbi:MAG: GatB/YqeY domain-containing protein [Candidatus Alcyoniella australis]|nr:GatB/YqeY domain-containing protein [Candidatus Alcyoniella australis]
MSLKKRINDDCVTALKAKEELRLSTLRMLKAAVQNRELKGSGELDDQAVIEVIASQIKQRKQSIESYAAANREDLANGERAELEILGEYMPQQLSVDELTPLVKQAIEEVGADSPKQMGAVMKAVMAKVRGAADGKIVSELVRKQLS